MGFLYEFNWILKLSDLDENNVCAGNTYSFTKHGVRAYPIDMPIDLVNKNWEVVAKCTISRITITSQATSGEYHVIEVYDKQTRKCLSEQWRDFLKITKKIENITDYSQIHIT